VFVLGTTLEVPLPMTVPGWRKGVVRGAIVGAVASIVPLELLLLFFAAFILAFATLAGRAWRSRDGRVLLQILPTTGAAILVAGVAVLLPTKYVDHEHVFGLPGRWVELKEVVNAVEGSWDSDVVPEETLHRRVCFSVPDPTLREVGTRLESELGIRMKIGYCGTGASLLWGMHPIGQPVFSVVQGSRAGGYGPK
jgi:hypothetical protein